MTPIVETLIAAALILGGLFGLVGSFGLLKLRDRMQRLHAPTKATTLGVGATLLAAALNHWWTMGISGLHYILITAFLVLTAPLTALFLAKAQLITTPRSDLPPTGTPRDWSHLDSP